MGKGKKQKVIGIKGCKRIGHQVQIQHINKLYHYTEPGARNCQYLLFYQLDNFFLSCVFIDHLYNV